ncbi:unnamed protein product [Protopolystoma xenopodis]|uniref:Tektin n=1 Tax=Protopolystoma xenopodis TaxID=117903 RepID=A0A3S5BM15_9PLAT|nr:unnamed protein product [Protopolystoma xenopodis]
MQQIEVANKATRRAHALHQNVMDDIRQNEHSSRQANKEMMVLRDELQTWKDEISNMEHEVSCLTSVFMCRSLAKGKAEDFYELKGESIT